MIKFENVSVTYPGGVKALKDLDLEIKEGDFIIIVGLSGAGKSTLLRTINNLVKPTNGTVYLEGKDVTNAKKRDLKNIRSQIGMIFQTFNLVNRSTVLKNVLTGRLSTISTFRSIFGLWPKDQKQLAFEALDQVEILEKAYVRASNLSGGQQQRLCIARTIAVEPDTILMDEPCSALDPVATKKIEDLMQILVKDFSILIVTHNMQQASRVSNYCAFFTTKATDDGRRTGELVEYSDTKTMFTNPSESLTEEYISGRFG